MIRPVKTSHAMPALSSRAAAAASAGDQSRRIFLEQVSTLYRYMPPVLATNFIVSSAMLYGLWGIVSQTRLAAWMGLMLLVLGARLATCIFYRRSTGSGSGQRAAIIFTLGTGLTGLLWGSAGVALFPAQNLEYQLFIMFILMGMGAGAVLSLSAYLPAFYAFFPVSMLPSSLVLFLRDDPIHTALGVMTLVYVGALSYFAHNINRSQKLTLTLRYENVQLVEQLRRQKEEAVQANSAKSRFLAAASHDLRQPLHALTLFTSTLDEYIRYPKVKQVVNQISASVHALHTLFNALLDISRLEAGVLLPEKAHFRLDDMFEKLKHAFLPEADAKGLRLVFEPRHFAVRSDPVLLEQVLRNYLSNAIRYTTQGGIDIVCSPENGNIRISVRDTGEGIPAEHHQAIFREFHQLSNPERDRSKGLGLGLAIVERIATLLDHPIGVQSTPGKGSVFWIEVEAGVAAALAEPSDGVGENNGQPVDGAWIVVIDDEIDIRIATRHLLESWGCRVIAAASEEEAMAELRRLRVIPHGIIADYRLRQNRTGVQAIERIQQEISADIPAVIITGDIAVERLREASLSGLQVLHKPVPPLKLRAFIRNAQKRRRSTQH
jgi:signal transduction histidine kinase/CheY-like chemotaxis protein